MALTTIKNSGLSGSIDLTTKVTGELPNANLATVGVAKGGTGLTSGTADQYLKFTGTTTLASAAVSAGKVAQVVHAESSGEIDVNNSSSFVDTNLEATITPSAATSKVLVWWSPRATFNWQDGTRAFGVSIERAISGGATTNVFSSGYDYEVGGSGSRTNGQTHVRPNWMKLDSPNTTSAITYNAQAQTESSGYVQFNGLNMKSDIILMEVLA